jgi:hypothetical protein
MYLPTLHGRFVYDINTHFITYERLGWGGLANDWGEHTIRWGIHLVNFILWYFFGASDHVWFLVAIGLHAIAATLLYHLVVRWLTVADVRQAGDVAFCGMILFLLSPYHSETIVWGATLFYLTFTVSLLSVLYCYMLYAQTSKIAYLISLYFLFLYCAITFEVFLVIPFILVVLTILFRDSSEYGISIGKFIRLFMIPQVIIVVLFFFWNKWLFGKWIGHYGASVHFNTDVFLLSANLTKYLFKYFYAHLFFSYRIRDKLYALLDHHRLLWAVISVYVFFGVVSVYLFVRAGISKGLRVAIALSALFILTLAPVLNLYFSFNKDIEQDRYLYVPSLFFYPLLSMFFFYCFRRIAWMPILFAVSVSIFFLHRNAMCWHEVGRINSKLVEGFKWGGAKRIFILANSDDFCGAYQMRDMPQSAFAEMLHVQRHIDIMPRSYDIMQYNMLQADDSCFHEIVDSSSIKLTFGQWRNWWWYKSFGASSYDSSLYSVKIDEWAHSFTVHFKDKRPGDVYIYQTCDHWEEIKDFR